MRDERRRRECTAAFNEAYDRAYETTMAKTEQYHSLKRWIRSSGGEVNVRKNTDACDE